MTARAVQSHQLPLTLAPDAPIDLRLHTTFSLLCYGFEPPTSTGSDSQMITALGILRGRLESGDVR